MKPKTTITGLVGISATVIAHSAHPEAGARDIVTLQLRYPRFIHSEVMTHRVFSRNASSSRAIPVKKVLEQVRNDPAMPFHWGINQPGMQADAVMSPQDARIAEVYWRESARRAADMAEQMMTHGLHKQVGNRILEPYQFMHTIVTATEWDNFFELRDHKDAEPQIRELAKCMKMAINISTPDALKYSEWHLPYVGSDELDEIGPQFAIAVSAARCARVSYLTHDGQTPSVEKDMALFESLVGSRPMHASPIEHQATPNSSQTENREFEGNFRNWLQMRKLWEDA